MGTLIRIITLVLTFTAALLPLVIGDIRNYVYTIFKEVYKTQVLLRTYNLCTLSGEHFVVKFYRENALNARLVLETAEKAYNQLIKKYNFNDKKIPIVIYPSRQELNACFGWSANESAMGAYYGGVIRVLSPEVWIKNKDKQREIFMTSGPMVHELTHLIIDELTRGNVPRWFTEGIAQYEEYKLTGFRFSEPGWSKPYYNFQEMDKGFDQLNDQSLAYWQSLLAVEYLVEVYSEGIIKHILILLSQGKNMDEVLQKVIGVNTVEFQINWQNWVIKKLKNNQRWI